MKIRRILQKPALFPLQVLQFSFLNYVSRICALGSRTNATKITKFDLTKIKLWNSDDVDLPHFDELTHCEIAKWAIFKVHSNVFFVLELQAIPDQYYDRTTSEYRSRFRYEKQQQQDKKVLTQYAFSDDLNEQQQLFASYYNRVATMPGVTRIREMLPDKLGSKLLLRVRNYCSRKRKRKLFLVFIHPSY